MNNTRYLLRSGLAAIAAATALVPTLATAQLAPGTTTGPIILPESTLPSAAAPAPTIVLPETAPVVAPSPEPVVAETAPETVAAPPATTTATTTRPAVTRSQIAQRTTPVRTAAPVQTSTAAETPIAAPEQATTTANLAGADLAVGPQIDSAQPSATEIAPAETQREDMTEALAQILAGLLVAGVAVGGLILLLRRRRRDALAEPMQIERPIVREPVPTRPLETPSTPALAAAIPVMAREATVHTNGGLPNQGAAIALPREAPTDFEERSELLRRMVEARPDRANPFRSPGARLKRARLILASLGRTFESRPPRIDLSQYTSNWPALARRDRLAST
ncbi:MAG: hypothetical protein ACK4NZ_07245 [Tsuneonella sp.]